jgi:hypothetical protein
MIIVNGDGSVCYLILRLLAKRHFLASGMHNVKATLYKGTPPPHAQLSSLFSLVL